MLLQRIGSFEEEKTLKVVSIPQAVGAVATINFLLAISLEICFNTASGRCCCNTLFNSPLKYYFVSIPQAVGAVATGILESGDTTTACFNTASGRCCCNLFTIIYFKILMEVSIPQAVGAVATHGDVKHTLSGRPVSIPQAVGAVATTTSSL